MVSREKIINVCTGSVQDLACRASDSQSSGQVAGIQGFGRGIGCSHYYTFSRVATYRVFMLYFPVNHQT